MEMDNQTFFDRLESLTDNDTDRDSPQKASSKAPTKGSIPKRASNSGQGLNAATETLIWMQERSSEQVQEVSDALTPEKTPDIAAEASKRNAHSGDCRETGQPSKCLSQISGLVQKSPPLEAKNILGPGASAGILNEKQSTIDTRSLIAGHAVAPAPATTAELYTRESPRRSPRLAKGRLAHSFQPPPGISLEESTPLRRAPSSSTSLDHKESQEPTNPAAQRGRKRRRDMPSTPPARSFSEASTASATSDSQDLDRLIARTPVKTTTTKEARPSAAPSLVQATSRRDSPKSLLRFRRSIAADAGARLDSKRRPELTKSVTTMANSAQVSAPCKTRAKSQPAPKPKKVKGKRVLGVHMKPEKDHCLRGLVLHYLPQGLNRGVGIEIRPTRAHENGATISEEFHTGITHVCVDSMTWDYARVVRCFDGSDVPRHIHLVNENYIPNCIEARRVLPIGSRHRIKGHQEVMDAKDAAESAAENRDEPEFFGGVATQDYEVLDSQDQPVAKANADEEMPPPDTPASLQLKDDKRERQETPKKNLITSPYRQREFNLVKKQPLRRWIAPATPPRRSSTHKEVDQPSSVEKTPSAASQSALSNTQDSKQTHDALDDAIEESKGIAHLPLDDGEESDRDESQDDRDFRKARRSVTHLSPRSRQNAFACMHAGKDSEAPEGPNALTIAMLEKMATLYERSKTQFKGSAYRKAISSLRKEPGKITTKQQALRLNGVGARLADKIEEIATTNRLNGLEHAQQDRENNVLRSFLQVYGAGITQAQSWVDKGYRTLDDLHNKAALTTNQKIGLEHYEDFLSRIPRLEVERHASLVRSIAADISSNLEIVVGGSFRRGAHDCGDIDFLVTSKNESLSDDSLRNLVFGQLIPLLKARNYIQVALATSSGNGSKWHGAAALEGGKCWRRVDFLMVPPREWGAALIYFSGNDIFNRSIRLLASKKGMRLNQRGLYADVMRGPKRERVTEGKLLEGRSEERIFELLGVPYRPPEQRNIG